MNKKQRAMYDKAMQTDSPETFARMMTEEPNSHDWYAVLKAIENDWEETTGGHELAVDEMEYNNL